MTRYRLIGPRQDSLDWSGPECRALIDDLSLTGTVVESAHDYDALVMLGGDLMQDGSKSFLHRMTVLARAQALGKPTYLLNTVWRNNPTDFDDILQALSGMTVLGPSSARHLYKTHGLAAHMAPELALFAKVNTNATRTDFGGQVVATEAFTRTLGYVPPPRSDRLDWIGIDTQSFGWSSLVRSFKTASTVITGRPIGVLAAICAHRPFVAIKGESHAVEDLLESAGSAVPVAENLEEALHLVTWSSRNQPAYDALFDWVDAQRRPLLTDAVAPTTDGRKPPSAPTDVARALLAVHRRNHSLATTHFNRAAKRLKGRMPHPRLAAMAAAGIGDGARALELVANARRTKPDSFAYVKTLHQFSRDLTLWTSRRPGPEWWQLLRKAAFLASIGEAEEGATEAARAILSISDPVLATSARFLIACRFIPHRQQAMARHLFRTLPVADAPEEMVMQERLFFYSETRDYGEHSAQVLEAAEASAAWADPAFRQVVLSYRTLRYGTGPDEITRRRAALEDFPGHAGLQSRLISDACEAGEFEALDDLPGEVLRELAPRHLVLAQEMHRRALGSYPRHHFLFQHMEEERAKLMELLADRSASIAIVGNSPVELGRGHGPAIDAHDIVVRFNDFRVDPPFDADYGTRTQIHVQTYPIYGRLDFTKPPRGSLLVQRNAFNVFEPRDWEPVLTAFEQGQRITWLDRATYLGPANAVRCAPSAGLSLAHLMNQLRGPLDRSSFFGFSFVDQLYGEQKAHYFNDERPSLLHDWSREAAHFESLFERS